MPPKKQQNIISNGRDGSNGSDGSKWYIILSILLVILIFFIGILIYVVYTKKQVPSAQVMSCPIPPTQPVKIIQPVQSPQPVQIVQQPRENVPVYPNKLPQYNSQEYQQVGILTANEADKEPIVLPLFARKLRNNRDRWQYYTATDKNNMMRLPIRHDNMKCEEDIGCREIYEGDTLSVEIYQGRRFTATIYKVDAPRYFAEDY